MSLHSCATCGRAIPKGDCPFCVPNAGGRPRLRAGYAVVATVSTLALEACSHGACVGHVSPTDHVDADVAADVPTIPDPDGSFVFDAAPDATDASLDASDAAATDATDAPTDASSDGAGDG